MARLSSFFVILSIFLTVQGPRAAGSEEQQLQVLTIKISFKDYSERIFFPDDETELEGKLAKFNLGNEYIGANCLDIGGLRRHGGGGEDLSYSVLTSKFLFGDEEAEVTAQITKGLTALFTTKKQTPNVEVTVGPRTSLSSLVQVVANNHGKGEFVLLKQALPQLNSSCKIGFAKYVNYTQQQATKEGLEFLHAQGLKSLSNSWLSIRSFDMREKIYEFDTLE